MGIIDTSIKGTARLAGLIGFGKKVLENPIGQFGLSAVPDIGLGLMLGQDLTSLGVGVAGGGVGQAVGSQLAGRGAKLFGAGQGAQNMARNLGGFAGYTGGSAAAYNLALPLIQPQGLMPMEQSQQQMDNVDLGQLTPEQIQKLKAAAAQQAAKAQYQAQAMQQYGGYQ